MRFSSAICLFVLASSRADAFGVYPQSVRTGRTAFTTSADVVAPSRGTLTKVEGVKNGPAKEDTPIKALVSRQMATRPNRRGFIRP